MSVHTEQLPGERIIIESFSADYSPTTEGTPVMDKGGNILDQQPEPVIYILDTLAMDIGLDDLMVAANKATRQTAIFKHPKILELIILTKSRLVEVAARGMNSPIFGNVKIRVFGSRDEALAYARQKLALRKAM